VAVFKYSALVLGKENADHYEKGTVVASDQLDALDKLRRASFTQIKLKQIKGFNALFSKFSADVR